MADFKKYSDGKDLDGASGIELDGSYHETLDIVIALFKALIKKGVISKADVIGEL